MPFTKKVVAGLTAATPQALSPVRLGASYGRVLGFKGRNYASSAKALAGTDTAQKVKIADADGKVIFLDATDRDYATAAVTVMFAQDDTATGLTAIATDATGATVTAGAGQNQVVRSPVTCSIVNGGTATDYFEIELMVEI